MQLKDRVVVVTGGSSGLGQACAEAFHAKGAKVAIFDLKDDAGKALAKRLGSGALFAAVDVANEASVAGGINQTMSAFARIDVCVNCAGIPNAGKTLGRDGPLPLRHFARVIEVNLVGTFNVIRLTAAEMTKNEPDPVTGERGAFINTASAAAWDGQVGQAAYSASKAGIVGMALPIARDLSAYGIRINTIAPGVFDTAMMAGMPEKVRDAIVRLLEFPRRLGHPAEFASLAIHLAENPYINGEVIRIDAATRLPAR